jgi:DNA modification methylase
MNSIPITQIDEGQRYRKDYGDLTFLKDSLGRLGSIHPIVLSREADGRYRLIAGGRRFRAYNELKVTEVFHASILDPTHLGYLFEDEVPEHRRREAELDENLGHLKTSWQEECVAIADLHELKRQQNDLKWGIVQTAHLLGKGYGKTNVNYAVRIAERLRAKEEEFLECDNMSDAIALLVKRKEEAALAELQRRAVSRVDTTSLDSFLDTINIGSIAKPPTDDETLTAKDSLAIIAGATPESKPQTKTDKVVVPLSIMFRNEDFQKAAYQFQDGYFDHVVTDIPYAIDMDMMDKFKKIDDVKDEHEVEVNFALFEPFLSSSYRLTKSGGFCIFFYDLEWHETLQALAEEVGWKVQRWPFIACKTSACRNSTAQYNTTKNYETFMLLRKDEQTVLRKQVPSSWKPYDFSAERKLYNNQFAKPFELWKDIYDMISIPGQKVWSPFCGEMSECRAAVNCGLIPFGSEINKNHYLRGLENMKGVYALVHKSNVEFV